MLHHNFWHLNRVRQESSQIPQSAKLDGETELVVVAAALGNQREVGFVQEEVAGELLWGRVNSEPPVAGSLFIA